MDTLKELPEDKVTSFIPAVVRKSLVAFNSTWDMTITGALMLAIACNNTPGMALYMLSVIDPKPGQIVTDTDVIRHFPMGFTGDWGKTWDAFKDTDQRAVFKN